MDRTLEHLEGSNSGKHWMDNALGIQSEDEEEDDAESYYDL